MKFVVRGNWRALVVEKRVNVIDFRHSCEAELEPLVPYARFWAVTAPKARFDCFDDDNRKQLRSFGNALREWSTGWPEPDENYTCSFDAATDGPYSRYVQSVFAKTLPGATVFYPKW